MNTKFIDKWEGLISLLWVVMVFFVVFFVGNQVVFEPSWFRDLALPLDWAGSMDTTKPWLCGLVLLVGWWGIGLVFAISGLKHGALLSRICAIISIAAFVLFVLALFWPVYSA